MPTDNLNNKRGRNLLVIAIILNAVAMVVAPLLIGVSRDFDALYTMDHVQDLCRINAIIVDDAAIQKLVNRPIGPGWSEVSRLIIPRGQFDFSQIAVASLFATNAILATSALMLSRQSSKKSPENADAATP